MSMKSSLLLYQEQISHFKSPSLSNKTINISTISHQSPNGSLSVKLFPPKGTFPGVFPEIFGEGRAARFAKYAILLTLLIYDLTNYLLYPV